MKVFRRSDAARNQLVLPAVAVGNFDGVHCGHQALFAKARELARATGGEAVALTFAPHPASFFNPALAPPLITTLAQKLAALRECGLDAVVIEPFHKALAGLSPHEFVQTIITYNLGAAHVVVGEGFRFGRKKSGSFETLAHLGKSAGFSTHGIPTVSVSSIAVSSSKIREFLLLGRVGGASLLLGRDYCVEGVVEHGKARGRTIGIPTANVASENEIAPRRGVYAGWVRIASNEVYRAVINIGMNPTFEQADKMSIEAHLLDFDGDLYGTRISVYFTQRLREERRFESVAALVEAIHHDIAEARELLREPAVAAGGC